jgi:hypothetical protein
MDFPRHERYYLEDGTVNIMVSASAPSLPALVYISADVLGRWTVSTSKSIVSFLSGTLSSFGNYFALQVYNSVATVRQRQRLFAPKISTKMSL